MNLPEVNRANVDHFINLFNLNDALEGVTINCLTLYPHCDHDRKEFSKLSAVCTLGFNFKVDIDIYYTSGVGNIYKMKIRVDDADVRKEICSFTNYLQRQKNLSFAIITLKKLAIAIAERKLILDMLYLQTYGNIVTKPHEDRGVSITCNIRQIVYFKSYWKIHLDCYNHILMDVIDFTVTKKDNLFHSSVRDSMNFLIQPNLPYDVKVKFWMIITNAVNVKIKQPVIEILENSDFDHKDYILVRNLEVDNGITEQYEILESDEDCHIVEN